jgi:signal transduction histidine kinase
MFLTMDSTLLTTGHAELAAAYLQLAVTVGLVGLCATLNWRYRRRYFALWTIAWAIYALRVGAMIAFELTESQVWLFWHQVTAGWTAGALLWAAMVFSQRAEWRAGYAALSFFPVIWSFIGIYIVDDILLAAVPMVAFLSLTTAGAGWAFLQYDRLVRSPAGRFLAAVLFLWALHHLDYLVLRAQGTWNPWGYYLDIGFEISVGLGILLLVLEDLDQGLKSLTALSGELQGRLSAEEPVAEAMLRRALSLRGVHGSALWLATPGGGHFVQGAGVAALWPFEGSPEAALRGAERVRAERVPHVTRARPGTAAAGTATGDQHAYTAALPIIGEDDVVGALVVVGAVRDPFTVLDSEFLLAFGQQVGVALANEDLHKDLTARTEELERLQTRMIHQHEEERHRIWRELHDETAQVLAALNLQLGVIAERSDAATAPALERARSLLGEGIKGIRSVTRDLRPVALDDLGLVPAMRGLARDFDDADVLRVVFLAPHALPLLTSDIESALYRSMQEALSNAVRHGADTEITVSLAASSDEVRLCVEDDGPGFPDDAMERLRSRGGLAGIRERVGQFGGDLRIENRREGGARVIVRVPIASDSEDHDGTPEKDNR